MNVGSLFAGIGGFELGLERAGFKIGWQVELDPWCRSILQRHFPRARRFEDVCEVGAGELAPVDLICGGFPCQDLSSAGRGAGLDGARSGLWSEFARIVRELRPGYVVVENVPTLLTGKGKRWDRAPIGRVLGDLAEVGYDAEWACLAAREFGAPHLRKRILLVAYPDQSRLEGQRREPRLGEDRREGQVGGGRPAGRARTVADPDGLRSSRRRSRKIPRVDILGRPPLESEGCGEALPGLPEEQWKSEPRVGRVAHGVPGRVDRIKGLGNALVPQIAEWIGRRILAYEAAAVSSGDAHPEVRAQQEPSR